MTDTPSFDELADDDDTLDGHPDLGDAADPAAVDPDHTPDPDYHEPPPDAVPDVDR